MAEKWVWVDLSECGASEGPPALIFRPNEFFGLLKFWPFENSAFRSKIVYLDLGSFSGSCKNSFIIYMYVKFEQIFNHN